MQHSVALTVQPDLERFEAVGTQRHGVDIHSMPFQNHLLRLLPPRPRANHKVASLGLLLRLEHAAATGPEGERAVLADHVLHPDLRLVGHVPSDVGHVHACRPRRGHCVEARSLSVGHVLGIEDDCLLPKFQVRIDLLQVQGWRVVCVHDIEERLHKCHHPAGLHHRPHVRLVGAQRQHLQVTPLHATQRAGCCSDLHTVLQQTSNAVALQAIKVKSGDERASARIHQALRLGAPARGSKAGTPAV
mmetsp:Transcript_21778/g.50824  ORF Transcript_21778/g.50824 Transcript_21778/m.50824 type:complete len:246 (+) Transcript_21778:645-1382(+)